MKIIVITGSTRGIGYGLAESFLAHDCAVIISGRTQASVAAATKELSSLYNSDCILGQPCNVADYDQVLALWAAASKRYGRVDIWINNAGLGNLYRKAWNQPPELMQAVVKTNLLGMMYGTQVAYNAMVKQGSGAIYNMYGFGSNGRQREGLAVYGSSKRGAAYYTEAFIEEMPGESPVLIGTLNPGMVVTDLLTEAFDDPTELERAKRVFNILAEQVETITPWLADRVLANEKHGAAIQYLTTPKIIWRFLTAPFNQRELFDAQP